MDLVVHLFESRSLRIARLGGYAFVALYGVLAWMHNPVSKYLNTIGAVPHSRTLGLLLLWLALGLTVLEGCSSASLPPARSSPPAVAGGSPWSSVSSLPLTGG